MRLLLLALPVLLAFAPQEDLDSRIDAFAGKIVPGNDETVVRFQKALKGRAGKIVLRDRIEKAADSLRSQSERDAVPDYFKARFEDANGVYKLRKGQEDYRRRLLEDFAACKADMDRIRPIVKEVADNLVDTPEVNLKLKTYLSHPSTIESVYLGEIRTKSRPDLYLLLRKLGEIFTQSEDGRFFIPEARYEIADKFARVGRSVIDTTGVVSAQIAKACENLVEIDDLHKRLKKVASDPLLAMVILKDALNNADPADLDPVIQKLKDQAEELEKKLPEIFEQTPKGKVLVEKAYNGVTKVLQTYEQARSKAALLREPGRQLAERLRQGDERLETFRKMLQSDVVLILLDVDVGGEEADPAKYVAAQIRKAVAKGADGKYRVLPEVAEHLDQELKDPVRKGEKEDRGLKIVSMYGEKIEDKELREVFTSRYGKFEVERTMKELLSVRNYDGLKSWTERHFDASIRMKAASRSEIEAVLAEVDRLEKESKKNDLKD
jgi:hypothetical protein